MKKVLSVLILIVFAMGFCMARGKKNYVASTSWVASIAQLAGIDDVVSIAPANLKHPPEYEITPTDVYTISKADLFMQAGYERMMKTLSMAVQLNQDKVVKVTTTNTLENLKAMTIMLAEKAGTEKKANKNFAKLEKLVQDARERIAQSPNREIEVFANVNQAEFARDLGLNVVSTFGSGQLTSDQIAQAALNKYILVIDNVHSPVASPISSVSPESKIIFFRNFPDSLGKDALFNVISENLNTLWATGLF